MKNKMTLCDEYSLLKYVDAVNEYIQSFSEQQKVRFFNSEVSVLANMIEYKTDAYSVVNRICNCSAKEAIEVVNVFSSYLDQEHDAILLSLINYCIQQNMQTNDLTL